MMSHVQNLHPQIQSFDFLPEGGQTGALLRSIDWTKHPLGPPRDWSATLKITLGIIFSSRHPMLLWWGEELIQFYNDAYLPSFGKGKHPQAMGQRGQECWPEIWPTLCPQIEDVLSRGRPSWNEDHLIPIFRNGRIEDTYWTYSHSAVRDESGEIQGILVVCTETTSKVPPFRELERSRLVETSELLSTSGLITDISERLRAEEGISRDITESKSNEIRLKFKRHLLETIFQESAAAIVIWRGPHLIYEKINPQFEAFKPGHVVLEKPLLEVFPELKNQPIFQIIQEVFKTGKPYTGSEVQVKLARHEGGPLENHYFNFTLRRLNTPDGKPYGVYSHAVEVTEQVLAGRALEESKNELERTIRELEQERDLREQFVATLSHDLRTPLTAARLSAQMLVLKTLKPETSQRMSDRIIDYIDRVDKMIRDLLDASQIRAGETLSIEMTPCNLVRILSETLDGLKMLHGDRFVFHAPQEMQGYWNESGIRRTLENLCQNAVKYGDPGEIQIRLKHTDGFVTICVHNKGSPISPKDQEKLFDPFKRLHSSPGGRQIKGWGLGLTLVKGIAESHGGQVQVESEPGSGTTFTVSLPVDCRINGELESRLQSNGLPFK